MCSLVKPTELREVWSLICYSFKVHQTDEPFYKPCSKRVLKKYRKKKKRCCLLRAQIKLL